MAFDAAEMNGRFDRIQCQGGKESSSRGKRRVFLCRKTVKAKVEDKFIPASFRKIEGRGTLVGAKDQRERDIYLVDDQNPGVRKSERREQKICQGRSNCQRRDGER